MYVDGVGDLVVVADSRGINGLRQSQIVDQFIQVDIGDVGIVLRVAIADAGIGDGQIVNVGWRSKQPIVTVVADIGVRCRIAVIDRVQQLGRITTDLGDIAERSLGDIGNDRDPSQGDGVTRSEIDHRERHPIGATRHRRASC